ncbi:MAG: response regulator [Herpetosiphonaceae bacterium]|nr:response regulator [Herpetosiphonaceae bacterium]
MDSPVEQLSFELPTSLQQANILIVEDDLGTGTLLKELLSTEGYDVHWTQDGNEAIALVEAGEPDLVLLDVMLPRTSGYEVCRRIKAIQGFFTPVILLTARSTVKDKIKGFEAGGDDYIVKPFINDELLVRVRSMLRIRLMEREQERLSRQMRELATTNAQLYEQAREDAEIKAALLQELNHRVRNNLAAISGFLEMELVRAEPGSAQDVLQRATSRVRSMGIVHDVLTSHENQLAPFHEVAERLARTIQPFYDPHQQAVVTVSGDPLLLPTEQVSPMVMVLNELLTNSFRHAFPADRSGEVVVTLEDKPRSYQMIVADNGIGLRSDFETAGRSSGQQVVQRLIGSYLKGTCRWETDNGTKVTVEFPRSRK